MTAARWIPLAGAANVRDLGGLPTIDGAAVRPNRLIRSDNLQGLTPEDVTLLLEVHGVRAVADLRTGVEVDAEGPGPLTREPLVRIGHFSLFPEAGQRTDAAATDENDDDDPSAAGDDPAGDGTPVVLPWQNRKLDPDEIRERGATAVYLRYLADRGEAAVEALRFVATTDGATIVHCAAGKDRTGVVVALALSEAGVDREAIVADYARSAERIEAIFARLRSSRTYADDLAGQDIDKHRTRPETMRRLLAVIDEQFGGVSTWLRSHGWTELDSATLRQKLLQ
jgi:protein tyrosine/serine phosphatase